MYWRLEWLQIALDEVIAIWRGAAGTRLALLEWAIADFNYRLIRDPENEGESRPQDQRLVFSWPLALLFEVFPDTRRVRIHHVWAYA
jgi:hypothetical protein